MPLTIPLIPSEPYYEFSIDLEDSLYTFEVSWNDRGQYWHFSLYDDTRQAISHNNVILLGSFPAWNVISDNAPPGVFSVVDLSGSSVDAGFDDIGTRVSLRYFPIAEFLAL